MWNSKYAPLFNQLKEKNGLSVFNNTVLNVLKSLNVLNRLCIVSLFYFVHHFKLNRAHGSRPPTSDKSTFLTVIPLASFLIGPMCSLKKMGKLHFPSSACTPSPHTSAQSKSLSHRANPEWVPVCSDKWSSLRRTLTTWWTCSARGPGLQLTSSPTIWTLQSPLSSVQNRILVYMSVMIIHNLKVSTCPASIYLPTSRLSFSFFAYFKH